MQLSELFVSHKQVDPVKFEPVQSDTDYGLYHNLDRARSAVNQDTSESTDVSNWRVGNSDSTQFDWVVKNGVSKESPISNEIWNNPYKGQKNKWIEDMTNAYRSAGLNDNAIKNLLAKNILESNWGNSAQGDYNFGNITTGSNWKGRFVQGKDKDAEGNPTSPKFRAYDSLEDYVTDELQFLKRLYDFNQNDDFDTFINKLQGNNSGKRRYAAARDYVNAVRNVYNGLS